MLVINVLIFPAVLANFGFDILAAIIGNSGAFIQQRIGLFCSRLFVHIQKLWLLIEPLIDSCTLWEIIGLVCADA